MTRVLIIDDERKIRDIYKRLLEDEGYQVLLAGSAGEATRIMISSDQVDLILLDINMPEIDGEFMREIIDEYDAELKIIVSSVRPLDEQRQMIPGAKDYFDKSGGTEILMKKINKALQNV